VDRLISSGCYLTPNASPTDCVGALALLPLGSLGHYDECVREEDVRIVPDRGIWTTSRVCLGSAGTADASEPNSLPQGFLEAEEVFNDPDIPAAASRPLREPLVLLPGRKAQPPKDTAHFRLPRSVHIIGVDSSRWSLNISCRLTDTFAIPTMIDSERFKLIYGP
jgi:hypothetical protein